MRRITHPTRRQLQIANIALYMLSSALLGALIELIADKGWPF